MRLPFSSPRIRPALALALALVAAPLGARAQSSPAPAPTASAPATAEASIADDPLFKRVLALNAGIKTYHATIHATVAFHSFPFITTHLDGDVYFKRPDKQAVVFDTVPLLAGSIKKFYPNVPAPSRWLAIYHTSILEDANGTTSYRLVPRKHGRVEHLDVRVDEATATIVGYTWTYEDGGDITFTQTWQALGANRVVTQQVGKVELPSYKADVTSAISDYHLNVPVADSVFTTDK